VKAKPRCYSAAEMARIVSSADEPLGTICFVLSSTGMRIGEVLAIQVEDLDYQRELIHVRSSLYAGALDTPKSEASIASLPMPLALAIRLKTFLASKHFRQNGLGLLFANRRGRPFSGEQTTGKEATPVIAVVGDSTRGLSRIPARYR
jgi:integrase